ncbi:hypothetical protein LZ189_20285, partial [Rhodovulum sulfidophilum]|nr:hypothetical protein [Rhodovulum sulfidophilum]
MFAQFPASLIRAVQVRLSRRFWLTVAAWLVEGTTACGQGAATTWRIAARFVSDDQLESEPPGGLRHMHARPEASV